MSTDGFQITIPDFDDDSEFATPIVGRSQPGGLWGNIGTVPESPTILTPLALPERSEKAYFHARGDSVTSEDSAHSIQLSARKIKPSFVHSANSSVATTGSSPFTKKSSFASLRNAFKSNKSNEIPPPMPPLDHQAYPALKNPFNATAASLAHSSPMSRQQPSTHTSPPHLRPSTPGSVRSGTNRDKSRSHHSQSGSLYHGSDVGSEQGYGHSMLASSPPVPPMPSAFAWLAGRDEARSSADIDDSIAIDPRTPSDYALHAIFIRFAAIAEGHIDEFLQQPLDREPLLQDMMGSGVDAKFDEVLQSLGKVAQKHARPVVDSVMRWRKSQTDDLSAETMQQYYSQSMPHARGMLLRDAHAMLAERKAVASVYLMCRALIAATDSISKDALGEAVGNSLEELTFEQFKRPDVKMLTQSANYRSNADLFATLLGQLSNVRFETVTDRFLVEFGPVAAGQVPRDSDFKYESLVKGLKYLQFKVWPPESFEECADFLASLSKSFENAHGFKLKCAFAESLVHLLHPIGKTAQAEVNHPEWAKAIELIYPKARDMMSKPRYWHVAYPLAVVALCVAPHEFFLKNWNACMDAGFSKLKEKPYRIPIMNGMMRLIWTYLYRCHESNSTATSKLENILKQFFPVNRLTVVPQEEHLEPLTYIVHFILSRHIDFGSDFCMELLQERAISSAQPGHIATLLAPERMSIALQAILLSVHAIERDEPIPAWPSSADFTRIASSEDYPTSSSFAPTVRQKAGWKDLIDRCGTCLHTIVISGFHAVGKMSIFDDQWAISRLSPTYEDAHNYSIRHHPEGSVAYPGQLAPQIAVLQACYRSWPCCLPSSLSVEDAFDMLLRGVMHVEPAVGEVASQALSRFMADPSYSAKLLSRFCSLLFDPVNISIEGSGQRLLVDSARLLNIWCAFAESWIRDTKQRPYQSLSGEEQDVIAANMDEIECGALFLLAHARRDAYTVGVKVLRALETLVEYVDLDVDPSASNSNLARSFRFVDALHGKLPLGSCMDGHDEILDTEEMHRLDTWKQSTRDDVLLRIAESNHIVDRNLWRHIFPFFIQQGMDHSAQLTAMFRERLVAAAARYHPLINQLSGVGVGIRAQPAVHSRSGIAAEKDTKLMNDSKGLIQQWHSWIKIICATAQVSDIRSAQSSRDHSRARSEINLDRENMVTTRDLFKYLSPFLDSDHAAFRDTTVSCISAFPTYGYSHLLEDLSILAARQFYDESRPKSTAAPVVGRMRRLERFHTAVARIYYLTAHHLHDLRSSGKQTALAHVLKYIRNMQTFLTTQDNRDSFSLQRLRRYFCGTVERLFDGLELLNNSDRFIPPNMHLSLYRLCEEWCQLGKQSESVNRRLILMQTAAAKSYSDPSDQAELIQRFQTETRALSNAAVGAMASLCRKAFFPPDLSSSSPTDRLQAEKLKPLAASPTLDRLTAILASFHEPVQACGKKALRSLLINPSANGSFLDEVLRRAFVTTQQLETSNVRFFAVVADVICNHPGHGFSFSQVVCLALSNLCHPLLEIRRQAFDMVETVHDQFAGIISMQQYEAAVGSSASSVYLHAHRLISDVLAGEHPDQAISVLVQFSAWIPQVFDTQSDRGSLLLLQSLEFWVPSIDLMEDDKSGLSRNGRSAIYHLMALTLRYSEIYPEQVLVLWTRLVDAPNQSNGHATVRFLLEQSHKVGSTIFIDCAAKVVACLSQSVVGRQLFEELCSVIVPARMLPSIEHKLAIPNAEDIELWSDLDVLFSDQPRLSLGVAQFALLFLSEVAIERYWEFQAQLPVLVHALFMHLTHRYQFVQERSRHMLFQLLRSCISGYDEVLDRSFHPSRSELKAMIVSIERESHSRLWKEDDTSSVAESKMHWLCGQIVGVLEPLYPQLLSEWGSLTLYWGTSCSIRPIAFRSLQLFRALMPRIGQSDLGMVLGRLSHTLAAEDVDFQNFNTEIFLTLIALASSSDLDIVLLPQMFWCAVACLSTTLESEFGYALNFLDALLSRLDLDDPPTAELLLAQKPLNWNGTLSMQSCLLKGLRSSVTSGLTLKLLQRLTKIDDPRLIDDSEGRLRDLYTLSLPWCLHAMSSTESNDEDLQEFALNIARLAEQEERPSIDRIMTSFAKARFRTKDDFLRQSVASLREHYGDEGWAEVVTLLMGLVLNRERWLRLHVLQIVKVLFQQREMRNPVKQMGSELLMPLLRLLETDMASQALDVLDEPIQISGGPAAKHVLRMSLHNHLQADVKEFESVAEIFGIPQDSGWCVPQASALRETCRSNVGAVFDMCNLKVPTRPSHIDFHPEDMIGLSDDADDDDLGDMVQNLHELSSFFREMPVAGHTRQLEARVAAILAKSSDSMTDIPQTPFVDVFDVTSVSSYEDSDDASDSDTESNLFEFDSPAIQLTYNLPHH